LEPKFLSDVTGCRKTQVSDCPSSTVFISWILNANLRYSLLLCRYISSICFSSATEMLPSSVIADECCFDWGL